MGGEVMLRRMPVELELLSGVSTAEAGGSQDGSVCRFRDVDTTEDGTKALGKRRMEKMSAAGERQGGELQAASGIQSKTSSHLWETTSEDEFTLVLDCCDLDVSKVEEVDVTSVSAMDSFPSEVASERSGVSSVNPQAAFIQKLVSWPSDRWRQKHQLFLLCSQTPGAQDGSSLPFQIDQWSLQVRKKGAASPEEFPRAVRICYETRPTGQSVRWTKDQDHRFVSGAITEYHTPVGYTL